MAGMIQMVGIFRQALVPKYISLGHPAVKTGQSSAVVRLKVLNPGILSGPGRKLIVLFHKSAQFDAKIVVFCLLSKAFNNV